MIETIRKHWKCTVCMTVVVVLAAVGFFVLGAHDFRTSSDQAEDLMMPSDTVDLILGASPDGLPTAAVAHIDLDIPDWCDVQVGCGQLQWLTTPKMLRESPP